MAKNCSYYELQCKILFFPQHHGVDLQESSSTLPALEIIPFAEHFIQQKKMLTYSTTTKATHEQNANAPVHALKNTCQYQNCQASSNRHNTYSPF